MKTYMFPGQGAQKKGMGRDLFDTYPEITESADEILGYSIKELCLTDPEDNLGKTQYTQPALYTVNALHYRQQLESGGEPDYVCGHSLGEYNALYAAGAFNFETGLKLVRKRGHLMSQIENGGMAAVVGLDKKVVEDILFEHKMEQRLYIANYNTPSQFVIAGPKSDIVSMEAAFKDNGAKIYVVLNTSGAFHTKYMEQARDEFDEFINGFKLADPMIPVISNLYARPYEPGRVNPTLVGQITGSVNWTGIIQYLRARNVEGFFEVGPGNVLTNLYRRICDESELVSADTVPETRCKREEETRSGPGVNGGTAISRKESGGKEFQGGYGTRSIRPESLGDMAFKADYNLKYAYLSGAMYRGIASKELVVKMGKSGMMGFFGTGSLPLEEIENAILYIRDHLTEDQPYGMNLLSNPLRPELENETVDLFIRYSVKHVEAAAFMHITPALVRYRLHGLKKAADGVVITENKVMGKISRPEVATAFLRPAPDQIVEKLLQKGRVTQEQAELARQVPMADDLCVEADSGGHTDQGVAYVLLPTIIRLRDEMAAHYKYAKKIRVGAAGGIGTPEAALSSFLLGADFILTGSINQCTVEAGTSDSAKDLLEKAGIADTAYAPAGDMFEMGSKVQVLRKGVFFPARANKLYELYTRYNGLNEIDEDTKRMLQEKYFHKSIDDIYSETKDYFKFMPEVIEKAESNSKFKMSLIFRWYFNYTTNLALDGVKDHEVNYQIQCGPALGSFNQWVKGTVLESWRNRHVDEIGRMLMEKTAELAEERLEQFFVNASN